MVRVKKRKLNLSEISQIAGRAGRHINDGTFGMSYFPGYAIDVETGERLNIIFAEDSWLTDENGADSDTSSSAGTYATITVV